MKVEVKEKEKKQEIKFPCLMISSCGSIVLFSEQNEGTLLLDNKGVYGIAYYDDSWIMDKFKPFHGQITLSND
jgi:hypothetical protein